MWKRRLLPTLLLLALTGVGLHARTPYLLAWRAALPWIFLGIGGLAAWKYRRLRVTALLLLLASSIPSALQYRATTQKEGVLVSDPQILQRLGRHFIVGYRNDAEIESLVKRGAIGGIFITQRNIQGKSAAQVRAEIAHWQNIQASLGLPPLYIATDQEGGRVSRLSPLVPALPSLAEWRKLRPVSEYAALQAASLVDLGVNLNFSPVVDLKLPGQADFLQPHTRLSERALSGDPEEVAAVAADYCAAFDRFGLRCTLKHFPGLGRVRADTHLSEGELNVSPAQLEKEDWIPFRQVLQSTPAFLMIGHVRVPELDPDAPASLSRPIVQGLIRETWGHEGIVVTDDFTMGPIAGRSGGVGRAAVDAIDAGVDLILISYDGELYYEAMAELLSSHAQGNLDVAMLRKSDARLGADFDRRTGGDQSPDLFDLGVADRNAAVGPIISPLQGAEIRHAVGQTVDHDGTACGQTLPTCALPVPGAGIRDM
ncbi:MAG: glycoside hydrolase family 3 protein [Deltaproteobacteria bacterium]|nr:glycoside hydrolase family 3 protein [Deltaproteobacteria bacterium]